MGLAQFAFRLVSPLVLIALAGCQNSTPDAADVSAQMLQDLGGPITNSVGMTLVPIPPGEFDMGTAAGDESEGEGRQKSGPETPQHTVRITQPFYMSAFEVTQQQYEQVMDARPWAGQPLVQEGPAFAASYISWDDAMQFCRRLSEQENVTYRLPTEAEWEYACRAGTSTAYSFGDDASQLEAVAWFDKNAYHNGEQYPHRVGQKTPNWWGLYDMHGNVYEWCSDWYGPYESADEPLVDPTGPESGRQRVWRGGSFSESSVNLRSASRLSFNRQDYRPGFAAGFRVVREFDNSSSSSSVKSSTTSLQGIDR